MKRYIYLPVLFLVLPLLVSAQLRKGIARVNQTTYTFKASLQFQRDTQALVHSPLFHIAEDKNKIGSLVEEVKLSVVSGDVVLELELEPSATGYLSIQLNAVRNEDTGRGFPLYSERLFGDLGTDIPTAPSRKKIILANTADNINPRELEGTVFFSLTVQLFDYIPFEGDFFKVKVQCNQPIPRLKVWKFRRGYLPNIIGLATAGGLYLAGNGLENDARTIFNGQYRSQKNKVAAEPLYQKANSKNQNARRLKDIAYTVLIIDGAWTIVQQLIQAERKQTFNDNCDNSALSSFRLKPVMHYLNYGLSSYSGIALCYTF